MRKQKAKLTEEEIAFALREGEYWDTHSLADVWDMTKPVRMNVDLRSSYLLIPLSSQLAGRLQRVASRKRVSVEKWLTRVVEKELAAMSH